MDADESNSVCLQIKLENVANNKQYVFEAKQWIRLDEDHDHWQEFPVYTADRARMLPSK